MFDAAYSLLWVGFTEKITFMRVLIRYHDFICMPLTLNLTSVKYNKMECVFLYKTKTGLRLSSGKSFFDIILFKSHLRSKYLKQSQFHTSWCGESPTIFFPYGIFPFSPKYHRQKRQEALIDWQLNSTIPPFCIAKHSPFLSHWSHLEIQSRNLYNANYNFIDVIAESIKLPFLSGTAVSSYPSIEKCLCKLNVFKRRANKKMRRKRRICIKAYRKIHDWWAQLRIA